MSDGHGRGDNERVIEDEGRNPSAFPLVSFLIYADNWTIDKFANASR